MPKPKKYDPIVKRALQQWKCLTPVHKAIKQACMMEDALDSAVGGPPPAAKTKTTLVIVDDKKEKSKEKAKKKTEDTKSDDNDS